MWLFSKNGFFSIVEHKDDHNLLLVRSRVKGDIDGCWPVKEKEGLGSDYRFRAPIRRSDVADRISQIVQDINYPDFKASVEDERRLSWYFQVWDVMARMQDQLQAEEAYGGEEESRRTR